MSKSLEIPNITIAGFALGSILINILFIALYLLVAKILLNIISKLIKRSKIDDTVKKFAISICRVAIYAVALIMILERFGVPITSVVALFGVIGVAISLSIQGSLSNLFNGIVLLFSKPFVIGDYVEVSGVSGVVDEVGLFYTLVQTVDNKMIYISNSEVFSAKIINYTKQSKRRVDIKVCASYDDAVANVKGALNHAINATSNILMNEDIDINVSNYGDSAIEYFVRVWCDTDKYWDVYFDLLENIKVSFDEKEIKMTYNHLNVHLVENK